MILKLLKQSALSYSSNKMSRWAASITFFILLSLAPLLVLCISFLQLLFSNVNAREELFVQLANIVPSQVLPTLDLLLGKPETGSNGLLSIIVSIIVVLFTASGMMLAVQDALHVIWSIKAKKGLHRTLIKRGIALILIILFSLLIGALSLLSIVTSAIASWLELYIVVPQFFVQIGNMVIFIIAMTVMLSVLIRMLSNVKITLKPAVLGALTITVLLYIGQIFIAMYLKYAAGSLSGAAGSILVLLLWVYYSAQVFLFGVELIKSASSELKLELEPMNGYEFEERKRVTIHTLTPIQKALVRYKTIESLVGFGLLAMRFKKKLNHVKFWSK